MGDHSPSPTEQITSHTARLRSEQEAGVGAGPESHGRGVNGFVGVGMREDIVEGAVGSGKVVLGGVGLVVRKLADCSKDIEVQSSCIQ